MQGEARQRTVIISNPQGLHMRPITAFVEAASQFQSEIYVSKDQEKVSGKSPFGLLTLAAEKGTVLVVEACGPDADDALLTLIEILEQTYPDE